MLLRIYSKPDCHLCDEAKSVLSKVAAEFEVAIQEINIEENADAYEKFRYDIPVVYMDEVKLFKHKVDEEKLRKALKCRQDACGP